MRDSSGRNDNTGPWESLVLRVGGLVVPRAPIGPQLVCQQGKAFARTYGVLLGTYETLRMPIECKVGTYWILGTVIVEVMVEIVPGWDPEMQILEIARLGFNKLGM